MFAAMIAGCSDDSTQRFAITFVNGAGENPLTGSGATEMQLEVKQGSAPLLQTTIELGAERVSYDVDWLNESVPIDIQARFTGGPNTLLAATPTFITNRTGGSAFALTGAASSCVRLETTTLLAARHDFGAMAYEQFALLVGGGGDASAIEYVDLLDLEARAFPETSVTSLTDLGTTHVQKVAEGLALALTENSGAFLFNMSDSTNRVSTVVLHNGASVHSALASTSNGAIVVGGQTNDNSAVARFTVIASDRTTTGGDLLQPRTDPIAIRLVDGVFVAGGGNDSAEYVNPANASSVAIDYNDGVREGGLALVSADATQALIFGGKDADGALRTDTLRIAGCPNCVVTAGPSWPDAREGASAIEGTFIVGGVDSTHVQTFDFETGAFVDRANLQRSRSAAQGIVLPSGVLLVFGGIDGATARRDVEYCFPAELRPL
ncbi:MAG: hypothetical protein R3A47_00470 [Polyangiales bacterium]